MTYLRFPLRVAVGLAVLTVERARDLPRQLTEFPVTVASQVLQASMRVQQHITELAIKGDNALSVLRPAEEAPSWATFDEDIEPNGGTAAAGAPEDEGRRKGDARTDTARSRVEDPWAQEERALGEEHTDGEFDSPGGPMLKEAGTATAPPAIAGYDELTLPQVRGRLRRLSLSELEELLAYEQRHANRPSFVGMLTRRIGNVRQQAREAGSEGSTPR